MKAGKSTGRVALLSGLVTAGCLLLPLFVGIATTLVGVVPEDVPEVVWLSTGGILGLLAGGLWGDVLARLTGITRRWRMRIAGLLALAPSFAANIVFLVWLVEQPIWLASGIEDLPEHQAFLIFFPYSALVVAFAAALILNLAVIKPMSALRNAGLVGLVSGVTFLIVTLLMDVLSYRIGSGLTGRLIDLPPMPFVTITASFVSALVGGGLLGVLLARSERRAGSELDSSHTITEQREIYT